MLYHSECANCCILDVHASIAVYFMEVHLLQSNSTVWRKGWIRSTRICVTPRKTSKDSRSVVDSVSCPGESKHKFCCKIIGNDLAKGFLVEW